MLANIEALASGETDGTCEASVGCSDKPNDYVRCSGKKCSRGYRSVTCDGITTVC